MVEKEEARTSQGRRHCLQKKNGRQGGQVRPSVITLHPYKLGVITELYSRLKALEERIDCHHSTGHKQGQNAGTQETGDRDHHVEVFGSFSLLHGAAS